MDYKQCGVWTYRRKQKFKILNIIGDIFLPVVVAVDVVGDGPGGQLVPLVGGAAWMTAW